MLKYKSAWIPPEVLAKSEIFSRAKNVILFIGDGMGYPTTTAGRILIGGEEYKERVKICTFEIRSKQTAQIEFD